MEAMPRTRARIGSSLKLKLRDIEAGFQIRRNDVSF
jgi:hypothetical protein